MRQNGRAGSVTGDEAPRPHPRRARTNPRDPSGSARATLLASLGARRRRCHAHARTPSREAERVDKLGRDRGVIEGVHLEGRVRGEEGSVEGDVSTDAHAVRDGFGGTAGRVFPSVPSIRRRSRSEARGGARARVERFRVVVHVVQARGPITGPVTRAEPAADAEIVVVVVPRRRRVERHSRADRA